MKCQVDETASSRNGKLKSSMLMKWQIEKCHADEMASLRNCKLMHWISDKMKMIK
jgi:hypothetical protein